MRHKRYGDRLIALIEGDEGSGGGTGGSESEGAPNGGQDDAQNGGSGDQGGSDTGQAPNGARDGDQGAGTGGSDDELGRWKGHARRHEDNFKAERDKRTAAEKDRDTANQRLKDVLKAAGYSDEEEDPAKVAERVTAERDQTAAELRNSRLERAAERYAARNGIDVDGLMDSRDFDGKLRKLDDSADDFSDQVKALIDAQVEARPALKPAEGDGKGKKQAPPSADMSGGGERTKSGPTSVEDFRKQRGAARR